ncbi:hypothetical protein DPMN_108546 [Dreissena polymorpha]|uniref:Uncharacterized protein n=1 Tax=Dreissena polymorpha TaxID=45954 RepID=A0A9D4QLB0_DREPO|nr:hypothetical protein DPMN_108546 [Dreissena polymorpha]
MSCCRRERTCCKRQTSAARPDRLRSGLQKDRTDDSEDGISYTHNSILDKGFLQHDGRLFDDRRRSIVDVLNIGYIATDGSLVLSDETISTRCLSKLSNKALCYSALYSNTSKLEYHVFDKIDGTTNKACFAGADG